MKTMTADPKTTVRLAASITTVEMPRRPGFGGYYHAHVQIRRYRDRDDRWVWPSREDRDIKHFLGDFEITCQGNCAEHAIEMEKPFYAWEVGFTRPHCVRLEETEKMVATLRHIGRHLVRKEETDGRPGSYADYVLRVCQALGVKEYVRVRPDGKDGGPVMITQIADEIRWLERAFMSGKDAEIESVKANFKVTYAQY